MRKSLLLIALFGVGLGTRVVSAQEAPPPREPRAESCRCAEPERLARREAFGRRMQLGPRARIRALRGFRGLAGPGFRDRAPGLPGRARLWAGPRAWRIRGDRRYVTI
jgi:hypothetical protein